MSAKQPSRKGITGLWMAQRRAEETRRPDRLFEDRLAARFVTAAGSAAPPMWAGPGRMKDYFAVRTRFFDDYLLQAAEAGCRQVVILAAGLDARAFSLKWPVSARVFELDLPEVLQFKDEVVAQVGLEPACERHTVPADRRCLWTPALTAADFDADQKSVWLAEGILMYLSREDGDALLESISRLAPIVVSWLSSTYGGNQRRRLLSAPLSSRLRGWALADVRRRPGRA